MAWIGHGASALAGTTALSILAALAPSPTLAQTAPPAPRAVAGPLAFPGAVGYGAAAKGGRGGQVIIVNKLADSGPGSLRACIDASGPRVCVFQVSGVIRFTTRPPVIRNPYLTIAGQTAPGAGITLAHGGGSVGYTPLLIKNTQDIVVRYIRVRNDRIGANRESEDSITIEHSDNVILDHVSASWARDELINGYADNDRITISNSIFAEGIPTHDKCALLASDPVDAQRLTFAGNVCAHNGDRNPDLNFPRGSCVEVVNNVFYNAASEFAEIWESFGGTPVALIGNSFIGGANTSRSTVAIARNLTGSIGPAKVYLWDNAFSGPMVQVSPLVAPVQVAGPPCIPTFAATSAATAYQTVLRGAGTLPRDNFDARIVSDVRNRTGAIVKQPGVIPAPNVTGKAYPDVDRDGMDDRWEASHGMNPKLFDAWGDANGDGILNLDAWLDELHRRLMSLTL
ncbi:Pectate lyase [Sphingomonas sp. EC-HK361]|uniref:pectate lyase family protein n=1 Tax=Sphingomonas sp. EC-HK361 TaxID=2038397 RepID=UPI00125BDDB6|nr:pectate lyase [Sphingomonas sp. EC-HK361]VVT18708.1 Pectate lyase [Sphingomonas sp. EC-HK361]